MPGEEEIQRHRFIVKEVRSGLEADDGGQTDNETVARRKKFADGWVWDYDTFLTNVPIADRVKGDFYLGERTPATMDRAWAEGHPKRGLIIVENDIGSEENATFSWSGDLTTEELEDELEWEAEHDYLLVKFVCRAKNAAGATVELRRVKESGAVDIITKLTFSSPRGESPLLLMNILKGQALAIKVTNAGGARNLVAKAVLRERT